MKHRASLSLSHLKSTSVLRHAAYFTLAFGLIPAHDASALPQGGTVTGGNATIDYNGAGNKVTINQTTNRGVIDWNTFNISNGETTRFNQPNSSSITLNKVNSANGASNIAGNLTANGRIIIQNGSGISFSSTSKVDVGGLIATTAGISDIAGFMAGSNTLNFDQAGNNKASIVNAGTITAAEGGLVALIAPGVENRGIISAKLGTVQLASAKTFTADFYGDGLYSFSLGDRTNQKPKDETNTDMDALVKNSGEIEGQQVYLTAKAAQNVVSNVINNTGIIEASGAHMEGGTIVLDGGNNGNVKVGGSLKAQSKNGNRGGDIAIKGQTIELAGATIDATGSKKGGNVDIGHKVKTDTVSIDGTSKIDVSATGNGNAGDVTVWSALSTTFSSGAQILGKGGANGGNGGSAEISSNGTLVFNGLVNLSSALGAAGRLLLDPTDLNIDSGFASALAGTLNTGTDVTASATNDITVTSAIDWTGIGSLVLAAAHDITLNAIVRSQSLTTGGDVTVAAGNNVTVNNNMLRTFAGDITVNAKDVTINGANGNIRAAGGAGIGGNVEINNTGVFANNTGLKNVVFTNGAGSHVFLNQNAGGSIQNAVDAIGTAAGGAKVTVGAGTYAEQVAIDQGNFTLTGAGDSTVIQAPAALATQFNAGGIDIKPIVYVNGVNDVTISNLKVDGGNVGDANYRMVGIAFNNAGGTIDHTTITNIQNNPFSGAQNGYGIYGFNSAGSHTITATNNSISNFQKNGMRFEGAGLTANAIDNTITGNGATSLIAQNGIIFMNGAVGSAVHNTITGIGYTGSNASATGILLFSAGDGVVVDDNTIDGAGYGYGVAVANSNGAQITDNTISNADYAVLADTANNFTATGNIITGSNIGISLEDVTGNTLLLGNTIGSWNGTGIEINNTDNAVLQLNDVTFGGAGGTGIKVADSDHTAIQGGTITNAGTGISVTNAIDTLIAHLSVQGGQNAISLNNADDVEAKQNTLNSNGGYNGILADNGSTGLKVTGGSITGYGNGVGIYAGSNNATVSGVTISGGNGIEAGYSNNLKATGNTIDVTGRGITFTNAQDAKISGNTITNPVGYAANEAAIGVTSATGTVEIDTNTITNPSNKRGIAISNTANSNVHDNTITGGKNGIRLSNAAGTQLTHNTVSNATLGISSSNSDNLVLTNNIVSGGTNGIYLDNSDNAQVTGGTVTGSGVGIYTNSDLTQVSGVAVDNHGVGGAVGVKFDGATNGSVVGGSVKGGTIGVGIYNGSDSTVVSTVNLQDLYVGIDAVNASNTSAFFNTTDNTAYGIVITNGTGNTFLLGNTIGSWNGGGIEINNTDGAQVYNNLITFGGHTGTGIKITDSDNTDVKGGKVTDSETGVSIANANGTQIESLAVQGGLTGIALNNADTTTIKTTNLTSPGGYNGILADNGSTGLKVTGGSISGYGNGIGIYAGSHDATISGVNIAGGNGIETGYSNNLKALNNTIAVTGRGVSFTNAQDVKISGNTITNPAGYAATENVINVFQATGTAEIDHNTITNPSNKRGIVVANTANANIHDNTVTGGARGIRLSNAAGAQLTHNTVSNAALGISSSNSDNLVLTNNIVSGGDNGIYLDNSDNAQVTGGSVTGVTTNGIYTNSDHTQISGVAIDNHGFGGSVGVKFDGATNGSVTGGSVKGGTIGVGIYNGSDTTTVDGVTLADLYVGVDAVNVNGIDVKNNHLDNIQNGIFVNNVTGDISVDHNTIKEYGMQDGIHILASKNAQVTNNIITGGNHGIWIDGSDNATVSGGTITNATTGIRVNPSVGVTISGLTINGGTTGIQLVDDTTTTVKNNTLKNQVTAVDVNNSTGLDAFGNKITGATAGFNIANGSDDAHIHNNTTIQAKNGVVIADSKNAQVNDNNITATIVGIKATAVKGLEALGNSILGATTGIDIANGKGIIDVDNNTIIANSDKTGIKITDTKNASLDQNNIVLSLLGSGTGTGILLNNADGTSINGGIITGKLNATGQNGVLVNDSDHVTVDGVNFLLGGSGISFLNGSDDAKANHNTFIGLATSGIADNGGHGFSAKGNDIFATPQGILVSQVTGPIDLTNNNIDGATGGISIDRSDNAKVTGGTISNSALGINVFDSNGTRIDDVTVKDGLVGVAILGGSDTKISNSKFRDLFFGIQALFTQDVRIVDNDLKNVQNAIALIGVTGSDNRVNRNDIRHADSAIVLASSKNVELANNIIDKSNIGISVQNSKNIDIHGGSITHTGNGIEVDSSLHTDIDDVLIEDGNTGITVNNGSHDTSITNNRIRDQKTGILASNTAKLSVDGNRFRDNKVGVDVAKSDNVDVTNNFFRGDKTAITFDKVTNGKIADNELKANGTGKRGIEVTRSNDVVIRDNTINGYAHAIDAKKVASLRVIGNDITNGNTTIKRSDGVLVKDNDIKNGDILVGNSDNAVIHNNTVKGGVGIGITLRNSDNGTITGNNVVGRTLGYLVENVNNVLFKNNRAKGNDTGVEFATVTNATVTHNRLLGSTLNGFDANGLTGATFTDNRFEGNAVDGLNIANSSGIVLTGNQFTTNGRGLVLNNTAGTTLSGDIFTGNVLGLDIVDSANTSISGVTFTIPTGGVGLRIFSSAAPATSSSTGTLVADTDFNGGDIAILIDGAGSDMQFADNNSTFTGNNFYFWLQNGAMAGMTLDASQQTFDGTRAVDFTYPQLVDAESKTVDDDTTLTLGNVFYSDVQPEGLTALEELQKKRKLFRTGIFSYAGKTLAAANEPVKFNYEVGAVKLSLLNGGNNAQNTTALIANRFANLAPAAGGTGKPAASSFADLSPAAGGPAPGDQGFANSFLGSNGAI